MGNTKPRTKKKEVRMREIQEAAKDVFFKRGFQKATIDEVAARAGTSKGTVYLYFKNKDDLYVSLMLPAFQEVKRLLLRLEEMVEQKRFKSPREFYMEFCDVLIRYYEYDPEAFNVFRASQLGNLFSTFSGETAERINRVGMENYSIARRILNKAIDEGLIPPVDVVKTVDIIWAVFQGILGVELDKLKWTKKDHIKDTIRYGFSLLLDGLLSEKK